MTDTVTTPSDGAAEGAARAIGDAAGSKRYGFVFDPWFCVGCGACAIACKIENNVPDGVRWNKVMNIGGSNPNTPSGVYPDLDRGYYTLNCQHCEKPLCVANCPTGASSQDPETGIVSVNCEECIGCGTCIEVCPYDGVRTLNESELKYSVGMAIGDKDVQKHIGLTVEKCTMCEHRVARGEEPACVNACRYYARHWGDFNDRESEVSQLLLSRPYYQLAAEEGTEPSTYFLEDLN